MALGGGGRSGLLRRQLSPPTESDLGPVTLQSFDQLGFEYGEAKDFLRQYKWAWGGTANNDEKPLILSVDDDEVNHLVIRNHVGKQCRIVEAMDGYQALDYLRSGEERPCMVLLDIMMPGMTGLEVVKEIRETLKLSHAVLPVIILSARAPIDDTFKDSLSSGATDFMPKPFNSQALAAKVEMYPKLRRDALTLYHKAMHYRKRVHDKIDEGVEVRSNVSHRSGHSDSASHPDNDDAKEEILRLRDDLEMEKDQAEELRRELADAEKEADRLRTEVEGLRARAEAECAKAQELSEAKGQLQAVREENSRLRAELDSVRARADAEEENSRLRAELDSVRARADAERASAEQEAARTGRELAAAREATSRSSAELESLRVQAATWRASTAQEQEPAVGANELGSLSLRTTKRVSTTMFFSDASKGTQRSNYSGMSSISSLDSAQRELRWLRTERQSNEQRFMEMLVKAAAREAELFRHKSTISKREREIAFLRETIEGISADGGADLSVASASVSQA